MLRCGADLAWFGLAWLALEHLLLLVHETHIALCCVRLRDLGWHTRTGGSKGWSFVHWSDAFVIDKETIGRMYNGKEN